MPRDIRRSPRKRAAEPPPWLVVGARIDYCSVIGEPPTAFDLVVSAGPEQLGGAGGTWVVWLTGKSSCVAVEACLQHGVTTEGR